MNTVLPTDSQPVNDVRALLALHGESFIRAAYVSVLGREVDEAGLAGYLHFLRKGEEPAQMLLILYRSKEAKSRDVAPISGLDQWAQAQEAASNRSGWKESVRRRAMALMHPLFNRIAVAEDQVCRLQVQLVQQNAQLEAMLTKHLARLERRGPVSSGDAQVMHGTDEPARRELSRLDLDGQEAYLKLRALLDRREMIDTP